MSSGPSCGGESSGDGTADEAGGWGGLCGSSMRGAGGAGESGRARVCRPDAVTHGTTCDQSVARRVGLGVGRWSRRRLGGWCGVWVVDAAREPVSVRKLAHTLLVFPERLRTLPDVCSEDAGGVVVE